VEEKVVTPTERGQITIPKEIREYLNINVKSKIKVYIEDNKIVLEPVTNLNCLLKELEEEVKEKGLTREEIERELESVRQSLVREISSDYKGND